MRIAVVGAGGVGGYFGGRLAASGADVVFLARPPHAAALRGDGLRIQSELGDVTAAVAVASDPREIGAVDLVIVAVKLYDTQAAVRDCALLLGDRTAVMSLQNGLDGLRQLCAAFGEQRVLGGVVKIASVIERPGLIRHTGTLAEWILGELDGTPSDRVASIGHLLAAAGIDHSISRHIRREIWDKLVFLSTFSGLTSLFRLPLSGWRDDPELRALATDCFAEAHAVAQAHGADLPADTAIRKTHRLDELPADMASSMLEDLRRGRRLELPWLSGAIVELGAEKGIETPNHRFICRALKPFIEGE